MLSIAYEVEGPAQGDPLLLIMGLGLSMEFWPESFRDLLVRQGFRVARFDNRDAGRSTHLTGLGAPSAFSLLTRRRPAYTLADMADDAVTVLDALGWESAHVAGISLGGMIAQTLAGRHPDRVRSLTSISSTPSPRIGRPLPHVLPLLLNGPVRDRDAAAERMVRVFRVIGSPAYPMQEEQIRAAAAHSYDQAHDPDGVRRQLAAIVSAADRRPMLRRLHVPALVVHGDADPLVRPSGGRATARAIAGAKLVIYPGMGHDLPAALQPDIVEEMTALARRWSPAH
jgi:pimeloyl-ACP methyl ester carboxylesterase